MVYLFLLLALGAGAWFIYRHFARQRRRAALLASELTDEARAIIAQQVPLLRRLPEKYRPALEGKIILFLDQVRFVGCDGLEVTQEMELSIAAQACLLVAGSDQWYSNLTTILIYPGAFKSRQQTHHGYVVTDQEIVRTGESWTRGPVILSWAHSEQGAMDDRDGHNVVLHEFAHQIDDLSGQTDGAPLMADGQSFADWERVILEAYDRHLANVAAGRTTVMDPYGTQGHEEFFAVAVEVFFEKPEAFKRAEPEVYDQLARLLNLDPASWDSA